MAKTFTHFRQQITRLRRNRNFVYGVPIIIFTVGGSFALEQFAKIRYEFSKVNPYKLPDQGVELFSTTTPEEEYEKLKQMNLNNWGNKRIPRPWEPEEKPS